MNRTLITGLIASAIAVAAIAAPAQAGHRSHGFKHHHAKHFSYKFNHFRKYTAYTYRSHYYTPVCYKYKWVYSYGHKKLVCAIWK